MSENKHTPEPWKVFNHSWSETSIIADGFDHGICLLDINHATEDSQEADGALMEANARRIVACVNACAGISTEALNAGAIQSRIESVCGELYEVKRQRDDLLSNLRFAVDLLTPIAGHTVQVERMRAAIARVEGN